MMLSSNMLLSDFKDKQVVRQLLVQQKKTKQLTSRMVLVALVSGDGLGERLLP